MNAEVARGHDGQGYVQPRPTQSEVQRCGGRNEDEKLRLIDLSMHM